MDFRERRIKEAADNEEVDAESDDDFKSKEAEDVEKAERKRKRKLRRMSLEKREMIESVDYKVFKKLSTIRFKNYEYKSPDSSMKLFWEQLREL